MNTRISKREHVALRVRADVQLMRAAVDLAMAGSDTTASVLRWALYAMAKRPAIQRRVRAELDAALHGERVSFGDRACLPYTQVLRPSNIPPTSTSTSSLPTHIRSEFLRNGGLFGLESAQY